MIRILQFLCVLSIRNGARYEFTTLRDAFVKGCWPHPIIKLNVNELNNLNEMGESYDLCDKIGNSLSELGKW